MKILCMGHASFDITLPVEQMVVENTKNRITIECKSGGGPAANAAYLLGLWGQTPTFAGVIGNDSYGQKIKKELSDVNVDTRYIETNYEHDSSLSFILINTITGARTVINAAKERLELTKYKFDFQPDIILTDGNDFAASSETIDFCPKAITVIDAGRVTDEIINLCKRIKYIVCSKEFAENVLKTKIEDDLKNLKDVYQAMVERFPKATIVITLGEKGSVYSINQEIKLMPAIKVKSIDTTAAGDIFHGAFIFGLANNFDIEKTVRLATITAGLSTTKFGGRLSTPTYKDVKAYYEKDYGSLIETAIADAEKNNLVNNSVTPTVEASASVNPVQPKANVVNDPIKPSDHVVKEDIVITEKNDI